MLKRGDIIAREFDTVRPLGEDTTGVVYEVTAHGSGQRYALHLLHAPMNGALTFGANADLASQHATTPLRVGVASAIVGVATVASTLRLDAQPAPGGTGCVAALTVGAAALRPLLSSLTPPVELHECTLPTTPPRRGGPSVLAARLQRTCERLEGLPLVRACRALVEASPSCGELDQRTTIELAVFSPPRALPNVVFELLRRCASHGNVARLLARAAVRRGDHPMLAALVAELAQPA
jgi:hypothetical protein